MLPPSTEDSAFLTFAFVDELFRTLIEKDVFTKADVIGILRACFEKS